MNLPKVLTPMDPNSPGPGWVELTSYPFTLRPGDVFKLLECNFYDGWWKQTSEAGLRVHSRAQVAGLRYWRYNPQQAAGLHEDEGG